jgi:hypothetical protein
METEKKDPRPPEEEPEDLEVPERDPEAVTGGTTLTELNHEIKKGIVSNFRV